MTPSEVKFLKRLLHAMGDADPWIEVGRFVGIDPRTVKTFDDLGLIVTEGRNVIQTWARLKKGAEIEYN